MSGEGGKLPSVDHGRRTDEGRDKKIVLVTPYNQLIYICLFVLQSVLNTVACILHVFLKTINKHPIITSLSAGGINDP